MSIRTRTTKLIARRHDLNYFKRMSPLRAWQWYLAVGALVCAVIWFSGSTLAHGNSAFTSGPLSSSHAVFGQQCELCHIPVIKATRWTPSFGRRNHVPDSACLSCHTGSASPHHPAESVNTPSCSSCHTEHVGAMHLANTADRGCTQCHAKLESRTGMLKVAASVENFGTAHPDFRPLRTASDMDKAATMSLKFDHAEHMRAGLRGPQGMTTTLQCQNCHNSALNAEGRPANGIAPVDFDKSCRSCHGLEFDSHITAEAPHERPDVVQAFVQKSMQDFAQAHPQVVSAEIQNWPNEPLLPGQPRMPPPHSTQEWIANRTTRAEVILWREKCALCHKDLARTSSATLTPAAFTGSIEDAARLPQIEHYNQLTRWMPSAVFSHPAHQAVQCAECHTAALSSEKGSDILMPSIATCRKCHDGLSSPQGPPVKTGHAESGCFLCHVYHGTGNGDLAAAHKVSEIASR